MNLFDKYVQTAFVGYTPLFFLFSFFNFYFGDGYIYIFNIELFTAPHFNFFLMLHRIYI
jgi:hypothetical protein